MKNIIISIITITYNAEKFVENTIRSVLNQTYSHIEYIIIDGNSSDNTLKIVNKYRENIDTVISEEDRGISDAFNKGIQYAHGDLIMFLNAGDTLINAGIIDKVVADWRKKGTDIIFYKVKIGEHTFSPFKKYRDDSKMIWSECQLPHQGAFVKKDIFKLVGGFNSCLKMRMDYDFWARCKGMGCSYSYIPEMIVSYMQGGTSMQINNANIFYKEGLGIKLIYGLPIHLIDIIQILTPKQVRTFFRRYIIR